MDIDVNNSNTNLSIFSDCLANQVQQTCCQDNRPHLQHQPLETYVVETASHTLSDGEFSSVEETWPGISQDIQIRVQGTAQTFHDHHGRHH